MAGTVRTVTTAQQSISPDSGIRFADVGFDYPNGTRAIDHLDLDLPAGTSTAIVGPSGCGKSTLLSLIAGLRTATRGVVEVDRSTRDRHPLTMVFQKDTILPWLTVEQNVRLYTRFQRVAKQEAAAKARELIRMGHLQGFESAYPNQLSGGMRRRVAFLAGVAPMPRVLLLDEPFSALDEPSRIAIHQDAFRIIREVGMTMVLVTHDIAEALTLCDRVVVLTSRPTRVFEVHQVPFGDDRNMLSLRDTPEFLRLYGLLWSQLRQQIEAGASHAD